MLIETRVFDDIFMIGLYYHIFADFKCNRDLPVNIASLNNQSVLYFNRSGNYKVTAKSQNNNTAVKVICLQYEHFE